MTTETVTVKTFVDPKDGAKLVTIPDAARLTGVHPRAVYRWIKQGKVRVRRLAGNGWMRVELESLWEGDGAAA